jgi:hypothetical protein
MQGPRSEYRIPTSWVGQKNSDEESSDLIRSPSGPKGSVMSKRAFSRVLVLEAERWTYGKHCTDGRRQGESREICKS